MDDGADGLGDDVEDVMDGGADGLGDDVEDALDVGDSRALECQFPYWIRHENFTWTLDQCKEFFKDPTRIPKYATLRKIFSALPYVAPEIPAQINVHLTDTVDNIPCLTTLVTTDDVVKMVEVFRDERKRLKYAKYISDIVSGRIYSPLVKLFDAKAYSALHEMAQSISLLGEDTDEEISTYVMRRSGRIGKYGKIDLTQRITLNLNVLLPEIIAFIIQQEDKLPLIFCRRSLTKSPF
eukprot:gene13377-14749_t